MQFFHTLSTASSRDLGFLFPHCILHGLICVLLNAFSFLYLEPNFVCSANAVDHESGIFFPCSYHQACGLFEGLSLPNLESSFKSITLDYQLYCERAHLKVISQSIMLLGSMLPSVFSVFVYFSARRRPYILSASALTVGLSALCLTLFTNIYLISFFGFIMHLGRGMWYIHSIVSINESYSENLRAAGLALLYCIHGCVAILMTTLFFHFQNWAVVMQRFFAFPIILLTIYYFLYYKFLRIKAELHPDFRKDLFQIELEELRREGLMDKDPYTFSQGKEDKDINFKVLFTKKVLIQNMISFAILTSAAYIFNTGLYLGGEMLLGNIYINMIVFGFIEAVFSILSGVLVTVYTPLVLLRFNYAVMGLFLSVFILQPNKESSNPWESLAFLFLVYSTKSALEMTWSLLGNVLKTIAHHKLQQSIFALSQAVARFLYLSLPVYIYFMEKLQFSPFFGYGILFIVARLSIRYLNPLHV